MPKKRWKEPKPRAAGGKKLIALMRGRGNKRMATDAIMAFTSGGRAASRLK